MKKIIKTLILAATVLTALFCLATVSSATNVVETGTCGDDVNYILYDDGKLIIIGTGEMDSGAFSDCAEIISIEILDGVTSIGEEVFLRCEGLTSIVIPDSVTSIGSGAFRGCTELTSIVLPDSVTSIGYRAFSLCAGLTNITVDKDNTVYHSNGNCIIETESKELILGCKNSVIPADGSVTSIGDYAFYDCIELTSIEIPNGVTSIGDSAFGGCTGLTSIEIPNSVDSIGDYAFGDCAELTSMEIPVSITSIGGGAFHNTKWYHNQPDGIIYVNKVACEYKGSKSKNTSITIIEGTKSISDYAFSGCTGLASIEIPNGVTSIGDYAFDGCAGLFEQNRARVAEYKKPPKG